MKSVSLFRYFKDSIFLRYSILKSLKPLNPSFLQILIIVVFDENVWLANETGNKVYYFLFVMIIALKEGVS